jgi:hypothetical protein
MLAMERRATLVGAALSAGLEMAVALRALHGSSGQWVDRRQTMRIPESFRITSPAEKETEHRSPSQDRVIRSHSRHLRTDANLCRADE